MVSIADLALNPLTLALAGYILLVMGLSAAVQPRRLEMVDLAEQMLADPKWNQEERDRINHLIDTCMSFLMGIALPAAIIVAIIRDIAGKSPPPSRVARDPRFDGIAARYLLSILATNPIAALFWVPLMAAMFAFYRATSCEDPESLVEQPLLSASDSIPLPAMLRAA